MKFKAWEARRHIERKYRTALKNLGRFLVSLISEDDEAEQIADKFIELSISDDFGDWAESLAYTIVTNTLDENSRTWRQAAAKSGEGRSIYKALQKELGGSVGDRVNQLIDDNAKYIKSVPQDVAQQLVHHVAEGAFGGARPDGSTNGFKQYVGDMAEWHAKLISRTETSKAMSALTQAQAEAIGCDWAMWHTSEDQRVRKSHVNMDEVLFRFSDKPAPELLVGEKSEGHYGPGEIYNCRCYAQPIILWEDIAWPARVYADGSITRMTKTQFQKRFGGIE